MNLLRTVVLAVSLLSAVSASAEPLSLFPGWPAAVSAGRVVKFSVEDPAVASGAVSEKGVLSLTGLKEGATKVTVFSVESAAPRVFEVRVEASGWDLVEVMVASASIKEDSVVTAEMMTTRWLPRALVTPSWVRAKDRQYVTNQPVLVPLYAGDVLLWSQFERRGK